MIRALLKLFSDYFINKGVMIKDKGLIQKKKPRPKGRGLSLFT